MVIQLHFSAAECTAQCTAESTAQISLVQPTKWELHTGILFKIGFGGGFGATLGGTFGGAKIQLNRLPVEWGWRASISAVDPLDFLPIG